MFLPWIEKYRPQTIEDVLGHNENINTIKNLLNNNSLPHLLFYGSPGTGKTSTIITLVKQIYGINVRLMTMKLDASDDRGINSVREDIKSFAEKSNMFIQGVRLIILDEVDSMTFDAQFALRRIIEKYSTLIRFCLICNYENKIIPAIKSRCANFRFNNIDDKYIICKLNLIAKNENITFDDNVLDTIAYLSRGDLRKAINLFQILFMQTNHITVSLCYQTYNYPTQNEIKNIFSLLTDTNLDFCFTCTEIKNIITEYNYMLTTIIYELLLTIINTQDILINSCDIIIELAKLEIMVFKSYSDIYISYLVSIFKK